MSKSRQLAALAVTAATALIAGCADSTGGAGNVVPTDSPSLPETAAAVDGPAFTGTVRDRAGAVVPGAAVVVTLLRSASERSQIAAGAAASLGTTCLFTAQGCRAPRAERAAAKDGTFAVPVPPNNGDAPVGVSITAVANVGEDGSRVGTTLLLGEQDVGGVRIDVPVAAEPMTLRRSGTSLGVTLPPVQGSKAIAETTLTISQLAAEGDASGATTNLTGTDVGLPFDLRLAEDSRLLLAASQPVSVGGRAGRVTATRVFGADVVPASRGAACSVTDSRGRQRPQADCGLTDGVLGQRWQPEDDPRCADGPCPGSAQNDHRDVRLVLDEALAARLIVVRGCGFTCTVAVSSDGRRYRDLPAPENSGPSGFYVQPLSGAPVRYVAIRTSTGGFFTSLREVSVFG